MQKTTVGEAPHLGLVGEEFAESFVRAAAAKRAADPTARLTPSEREAAAHLEESMVELRDDLEDRESAIDRRQNARSLSQTARARAARAAASDSGLRDAAEAVELVRRLQAESLSREDAVRLQELLITIDLRRRTGVRYDEVAALDREIGL
jgi:hypothetical protein